MVIRKFPPVAQADQYGLLAIGGDLEVESLLLAYQSGIFPWPFSDEYPAWFAPERRAVLFFENFKISKSMQKERRRNKFVFRHNTEFESVIRACASETNRKKQRGTWINEDVIQAYLNFHKAGYAHSIECFKDEKLVGGLYGVAIGAMFAGESMFYREPNASKLALWHTVETLKAKGITWIDCQVQSKFLESLGVTEVAREEFTRMAEEAVSTDLRLF